MTDAPKSPPKRDISVHVRFDPEEYAWLSKAAIAEGVAVGTYVRILMRRAMRQSDAPT